MEELEDSHLADVSFNTVTSFILFHDKATDFWISSDSLSNFVSYYGLFLRLFQHPQNVGTKF